MKGCKAFFKLYTLNDDLSLRGHRYMHTVKQPSQLRDHFIDNLSVVGVGGWGHHRTTVKRDLSTFSQIVFVDRFGCVVCAGKVRC